MPSSHPTTSPIMRMNSVSLSWSNDQEKKVVSHISFTVNQVSEELDLVYLVVYTECCICPFQEHPLLVIVGPVGAGKVLHVCRHSNHQLFSIY